MWLHRVTPPSYQAGLGVDCVWFAKDESEWTFQRWAFWPAEGLGQEELTPYERRHIAYNWQAP